MKDLQSIISDNLRRLRKNCGLTQMEFAEKINYSDKTVSKWETGESVPGIEAAMLIAAFFGVTLDDMVKENLPVTTATEKGRNVNRFVIMLLAVSAVWILATILFVYANLMELHNPWLLFIYGVPMSAAVALIFNAIWGHRRWNYVLVSALIWSLIATAYLQFLSLNMWIIFLAGVPLQIAVILWSQLKTQR